MTTPAHLLRLSHIRPLVRYVDEDQAVIDIHVHLKPPFPAKDALPLPDTVQVCVSVSADEGFRDEQISAMSLSATEGVVRFELVQPQRWWPAGLGDQSMYEVEVALLFNGEVVDDVSTAVGLTSVRRCNEDGRWVLLVNGQEFEANTVIPIDHFQENRLLPVAGDSIIVVRDHYGPDLLYEAADRAGILLVQCVPINSKARPEQDVIEHVARLAAHPSLAGWCVSPQGKLSQAVAGRIKELDPTHNVFIDAPSNWAA